MHLIRKNILNYNHIDVQKNYLILFMENCALINFVVDEDSTFFTILNTNLILFPQTFLTKSLYPLRLNTIKIKSKENFCLKYVVFKAKSSHKKRIIVLMHHINKRYSGEVKVMPKKQMIQGQMTKVVCTYILHILWDVFVCL